MYLWIDDVRQPSNKDCFWCKSVNEAKAMIYMYEHSFNSDTIIIDLDHDAGDFARDGGDYIRLLDWLEEQMLPDSGYFFHIHSMNPVGVMNMRAIIEKNGWKEI